MEPWFHNLRYNDIPCIIINICSPIKSYNKMYEAEIRYNDPRCNENPGLTMGMLLTEHKIILVRTIKSISDCRKYSITKKLLLH